MDKDLRFSISQQDIKKIIALRSASPVGPGPNPLIEDILTKCNGMRMADIIITLSAVLSTIEKLGPTPASGVSSSQLVMAGVPIFSKLIDSSIVKDSVH